MYLHISSYILYYIYTTHMYIQYMYINIYIYIHIIKHRMQSYYNTISMYQHVLTARDSKTLLNCCPNWGPVHLDCPLPARTGQRPCEAWNAESLGKSNDLWVIGTNFNRDYILKLTLVNNNVYLYIYIYSNIQHIICIHEDLIRELNHQM